eukprot:924061_1
MLDENIDENSYQLFNIRKYQLSRLSPVSCRTHPTTFNRWRSFAAIEERQSVLERLPTTYVSKWRTLEKIVEAAVTIWEEFLELLGYIQGAMGPHFVLVTLGRCEVSCTDKRTGRAKRVQMLARGDSWGDACFSSVGSKASLFAAKRSGESLIARGKVAVFTLQKKIYSKLIRSNHRTAISAETQTDDQPVSHAPKNAETDKSDEVKELIQHTLANILLFSSLSGEHLAEVAKCMWRREAKHGETIIRQGEQGDFFYLVETGKFNIFVQTPQESNPSASEATLVAVGESGSVFGELALMYESPRAATVVCEQAGTLWILDRYMFRYLLRIANKKKLEKYVAFLSRVPIISKLGRSKITCVAENLEEQTFQVGEMVVEDETYGDTFYIIRSGHAEVWDHPDPDKKELAHLRDLSEGDYFGERALMMDEMRSATVSAKGDVLTCLCLKRDAFRRLMGPLDQLMRPRLKKYRSSRNFSRSPLVLIEDKLVVPDKLEDLEVIGTLGCGAFGHVQLVQKKGADPVTYALKTVSTALVIAKGQQEHMKNERAVLERITTPFAVRLVRTFREEKRLHFLMEPVIGGELFSLLRELVKFNEPMARFYAGSVVLFFEHLHTRDIIYRDLKPENMLIGANGHIKIADFGFAKKITDRTFTLCGTPDYLPPEMVRGVAHGKGADWWTLGVLIFEMLAGFPPFSSEDPLTTYANITAGLLSFPEHFTMEATSICRGFLQTNARERLGVGFGLL